jgi:hypothetical protein
VPSEERKEAVDNTELCPVNDPAHLPRQLEAFQPREVVLPPRSGAALWFGGNW